MSDAPSLVIVTPEVYHIYGEGAEGTINGPVKGDTFDKKTKLVEHMSAIHKDDFIELFCANCNKANPRLKGIVIYYGLCTKGLKRRGSMELVRDYL